MGGNSRREALAAAKRAFVNFSESIAFDLIDRIYRAAAEREQWTGFCSALGVAVGGE